MHLHTSAVRHWSQSLHRAGLKEESAGNMISQEEGENTGFGSHTVTVIPHYFVCLKDGTRLAVKFWFPEGNPTEKWFGGVESHLVYDGLEGVADGRYPVIMEYIPYRKSDFTSPRDHRRHPWMASHGYVVARVDMRGAGDSDGLMYDEYLPQEQKDACEIIDWFSKQEWCNGRVGMYGKSWGGFNGLQVAYEQPPALKAVISLYSTDDRYETDIHYEGGCVLGSGMPSWASRMLIWNANPPNPRNRPDWEQVWRERLEKASDPWLTKWLSHQTRDEYWMHGSICKDYSKLESCPILAIGGWRDGYFNPVFRLASNVSTIKAIVGPWSHQWPDIAIPGPNMEFLQECLNWWDHHLKQKDNGVEQLPKLRVFIQESLPPPPLTETNLPGQWIQLPQWPPQHNDTNIKLFPLKDGSLSFKDRSISGARDWMTANFNAGCGLGCSEWLGWSFPQEGPYDQRSDDGLSLTWDTEELKEDLCVVGDPKLTLKFRVPDGTHAQLIARLCNVYPDGRSRYITRGVLNLNHLQGHGLGQPQALVPGQEYSTTLVLMSTAYIVPKGNRLRLAVSPNYFPIIWPSKSSSPVQILTGIESYLDLPTVDKISEIQLEPKYKSHMVSNSPKIGPPLPIHVTRNPTEPYKVTIRYEPSEGKYKRELRLDDGSYVVSDSKTHLTDFFSVFEQSEIVENDTLSAKYSISSDLEIKWPDEKSEINGKVSMSCHMSTDIECFILRNKLTVLKAGSTFFEKEWNDIIKRPFI